MNGIRSLETMRGAQVCCAVDYLSGDFGQDERLSREEAIVEAEDFLLLVTEWLGSALESRKEGCDQCTIGMRLNFNQTLQHRFFELRKALNCIDNAAGVNVKP